MHQQDNTVGRLLQQHREARGLKQHELASRVGYGGASRHSVVSRIETTPRGGFANPEQVSKLVRALHEEREFTLAEIHQLATTYLDLDTLSATSERLHLAVAIGGIAFSSFWSSVVANLAIHAGPSYHLILRPHGEDIGSEQEILRSFVDRAHNLHGVILAPAQGLYRGPSPRQAEIRRDLIRQLQDCDVPVVLLDRWLTDADQRALRMHAPIVSLEHYDAARKAVRKLREAGHDCIGLLLDLEHDRVQQERHRGAVDELQAQGMKFDRRLIIFGTAGQKVDPSALGDSPFGYHNLRANANVLLSERAGVPTPTALLCTTSYATIEAYVAIVRDRRLRIPDQISLLGFDDVGELRRLGISRVPYRPRDAALYAFDKIQEYHDPARKTHAHHDHLWQISYADADWNIATYEEPGTIKDIHDRGTTAEWDKALPTGAS
jgi:DNA-binding LacI/PurR family transcriptional regulator